MIKLISLICILLTLHLTQVVACEMDGSEGIMPENTLSIPEFSKDSNGMSRRLFSGLIDRVAKVYKYRFSELGGRLVLKKKWRDNTVNAYAEKKGKRYIVTMFGGLARHKAITPDGFALVVCHEIAHHIGGAPLIRVASRGWKVSNEGQADYFSTQKCFKRVFGSDDNVNIVSQMNIPALVTERCEQNYSNDNDIALCKRTAMAGMSLATLFQQGRGLPPVYFSTPDPKEVWNTWMLHPEPQCRLDTYFQGSLCSKDESAEVSFDDHRVSSCNSDDRDTVGIRPRCWFNPERY